MKIPLAICLAVLVCGCHIQIVRAPSQPSHTPHPSMPPKPVPPGVVTAPQEQPPMVALLAGSTWVTLGWQLSSADPATIVSQTLSYGIASGNYTNSITLGNTVTQYTVSNLVAATTYFFAVKCTSSANLSSVYSVELMYTTTNNVPPPTAPAPPTNLKVIATGP